MTTILPFIEQQAAYDNIHAGCQEKVDANEANSYNTDGTPFQSTEISILPCPSDLYAKMVQGNLQRTSYHGCLGDTYSQWDSGGPAGASGTPRGILVRYDQKVMDMGEVTDGTSNTLIISESLAGKNDGNIEYKYKIAVVTVPAGQETTFSPKNAADLKGTDGDLKQLSGADAGYGRKGVRWGSAQNGYSGFHTVLPPNSPSIQFRTGSESYPENFGAITASSNHSGGVNGGLLDGSVRFISETVDCGDLSEITNPTRTKAKSAYGVWGAYGTVAGGESKTL